MVAYNLDQAFAAARASIEGLYSGTCTVYRYDTVYDHETHSTITDMSVVYKDIPCRLSYNTDTAAKQTDTISSMTQQISLFLSPDIAVEPGSRISVTQNGVTNLFENSGQPIVHKSHQQITLTLVDQEA